MKIKFLTLLIFALTACKPSGQVSLLKASEFGQKSSAVNSKIIDVRSPEEYNEGYIKGAVNIDYNSVDFKDKINTLDKNSTYFLYCRSGVRSGKALEIMQSSGFKNIYGLEGGILEWVKEKMPVETPGNNNSDTSDNTNLISADPTDFKTAIFGDKLVFVDFNAKWCGPCKKMQPFVDMLKEERSKEVIVFSIDTDEETDIAKEYQIMNLPTVLLIKKGVVLYRREGYHDQESIYELVTKFK